MRNELPYFTNTYRPERKKIVWPDVKAPLPYSDRNRLFYPDIAFESAYTFDELRNKLLAHQHSYCSREGYSISLIDAHRFPYSQGKMAEEYYYLTPAGLAMHYTKCIHLSDIIQLRNEMDNTLFWLLSTTNKELNSRGCNLYTQEETPDLYFVQPLAAVLERIVTTIIH